MIKTIINLIFRGVFDLRLNPLVQALTLAAVTLVAFLGGLFLLIVSNLDAEMLRSKGEAVFLVYWRPDAPMESVQAQWDELANFPHIIDFQSFTPEEGLTLLSEGLGDEVNLTWLEDSNPIPPTAMLSFEPPQGSERAWNEEMIGTLEAIPNVDSVHYNPLRTDVSESWSRLTSRFFTPAMIFLILVLALVIGNTIKLSLFTRRNEVEILQLVGAKDWYIQLPMLVTGACQGFIGGLAALGLLKLVHMSLKDLLNFPPLFLKFDFFTLEQSAIFLAVLIGVSILSSLVATRR